ncbi:hypothetical protein EUA63_03380 [TM7 phylum sp. oral taxon 348]|nr:hypothetical protein EUA64_00875 [TM7 phylum sp. oral taxon 348]TWP19581.1 hypothetical protein EUA65_00150 [TM7 phylum sp. oral taxon 348]TWP19702.1 hypothetical protein EUA63_03380 [TM7 phylum sp. oral taxon 348]
MKRQKGAVSIFIVLFATMLFVAISIGFAIFMMRDQDRATDNDLSRSALDSAQAGVEDAKRVLAKYNDCTERNAGSPECVDLISTVRGGKCDTVAKILGGGQVEGDKIIRQSNNDEQLQQAYSCVKITPDTEDVVKSIKDESDMKIIPLKGVSNYDVVEVTWSKKSEGVSYDFSQSSKNRRLNSLNVRNKSNQVTAQLPTYEHWDEKWGAVMRVQAISYNAGDVNLRDLDGNARTVFLYPDNRVSRGSSSKVIEMETYDLHTPHSFTDDASRLDVAANKPATSVNGSSCDNRVANGEYMCKALLKLPSGKDTSYLTLAGIYARGKSVDVRVRLLKNDGSVVKFNNVQPKIDSTGRANNEFRRVEARVEATPSEDAVPVPRAAIASDGDLCKNYMITDNASDFSANGCSQSIIKPETQP